MSSLTHLPRALLTVSELLLIIAMVCSGDTYHMETSQLFCDADRMEWVLSERLQPSELTYDLHPPKSQTIIETPRLPFLVKLQVLIKVFTNGNPHCFVLESPIRITE